MPPAPVTPVKEINGHTAWVKRERVISVAADLFDERGYENTSVEAIADRMGVSKPFFYLHFAAKAEVLAEICARGAVALLGAVNGALEFPSSPAERLAEAARRVVFAVLANRRSLAILAREEKHLPPDDRDMVEEVHRTIEIRLTELLEEGVATGAFAVATPRLAAVTVLTVITSVQAWSRFEGQMSPDEVAREAAALVVAMAGAGEREASRETPIRPTRTWNATFGIQEKPENSQIITLCPAARATGGDVNSSTN